MSDLSSSSGGLKQFPPEIFGMMIAASFLHSTWNFLLRKAEGSMALMWASFVFSNIILTPIAVITVAVDPGDLPDLTSKFSPFHLFILASAAAQALYICLLPMAYSMGEVTRIYPLVRGSSLLFAVVINVAVFNDNVVWLGGIGIGVMLIGILCVGFVKQVNEMWKKKRATPEDPALTHNPNALSFQPGQPPVRHRLGDVELSSEVERQRVRQEVRDTVEKSSVERPDSPYVQRSERSSMMTPKTRAVQRMAEDTPDTSPVGSKIIAEPVESMALSAKPIEVVAVLDSSDDISLDSTDTEDGVRIRKLQSLSRSKSFRHSLSVFASVEPLNRLKFRAVPLALYIGLLTGSAAVADAQAMNAAVYGVALGPQWALLYCWLVWMLVCIFTAPYILIKKQAELRVLKQWRAVPYIIGIGPLAVGVYLIVLMAYLRANGSLSYVTTLRESSLIFAAFWSVLCLKEQLSPVKLVGVFLLISGQVIIALASVFFEV